MIEEETQCVCAPFEAECQCVYLEQQNDVDDVMSTDSDYIEKTSVFSANFNSETL